MVDDLLEALLKKRSEKPGDRSRVEEIEEEEPFNIEENWEDVDLDERKEM